MRDILWAHILQTSKTSNTNSSLSVSCCSGAIRLKVAIIFYVPDEPDGLYHAALASIIMLSLERLVVALALLIQ